MYIFPNLHIVLTTLSVNIHTEFLPALFKLTVPTLSLVEVKRHIRSAGSINIFIHKLLEYLYKFKTAVHVKIELQKYKFLQSFKTTSRR